MTGPAVPSDEELRGDITDALVVELDSLGISSEMSCRASEYLADAMLPRVLAFAEAEGRRLAAEELRAAAEAIDADRRVCEARELGQAQRVAGEARSVVLERADALDGQP